MELKSFLPDALTNPRPVLPEEQGEYRSASGHLWWLDSGGWHNTRGSWLDSHARKYAPFTRLVPERPPVTLFEIACAYQDATNDHMIEDGIKAIATLVNGTRA
ncbi:hypothetical protein AEQ27_04045 [Frigoribacterium sp. RIT-PI-h]|nr:hypothetical protein AEQ27_04045 [Frigoribacterium sp. RIT-PI-h]